MSSRLFIIFLDKCIRDTNPPPNQQVLAYADNVVVLVDSIRELQEVGSTWMSTMSSKGMIIDTAKRKTEFMYKSRRKMKLHQANS